MLLFMAGVCFSLLYSVLYEVTNLYSTAVGHLNCFQFLAVMNSPAMNILVHAFW